MSRGRFFISCVLLLVKFNVSLGQDFNTTDEFPDGQMPPADSEYFPDGHMRLAGGPTPYEGRVEVYHDGQWGTVCDDDWDIYDAHVVCQYLNFSRAASALDGDSYGGGSGPIWLDDVKCRGDESDLSLCQSTGWGNGNCGHSEDAGVVCRPVIDPWSNSSLDQPTHHDVNHTAALPELLGALFDTGRDCDLQIGVRVDGDKADSICVHKLVLRLDQESPVLNGSLADLEINVTSNCSHYVTSFVRYLYTRQIDITSSSLQCVHGMASDWGLKELQEEVGRLYSWVLPQDPTFRTQLSLYEYSVRTANGAMQRACLRYLAWNFEELVLSPAWPAGVPPATAEALLSRSDLVVPSESYVLEAVESWEAARGAGGGANDTDTEDRFGLLKHVRFPMIPAEDLYRLRSPRYQAGRLLGFQFGAMRFAGRLPGELVAERKAAFFTPRIYTGKPWSFTFDSREARDYRRRKFFFRNHTRHTALADSFSTPVYGDVRWSTELHFPTMEHCPSAVDCDCPPTDVDCDCPSDVDCDGVSARLSVSTRSDGCKDGGASPAADSPGGAAKRLLVYGNKLVLSCAGRYVFHVEDFKRRDVAVVAVGGSAYPCDSRSHVYQVVVRPKYTAALVGEEEEEEEE